MESLAKRLCTSSSNGDEKETSCSSDILSSLHESILYRILSHLDMKQVVQTSLLSKSWRSFWISTPFLTFDNKHLFRSDQNYNAKDFTYFVDRVLCFRDYSTIQTFNLIWDTEYCKPTHIYSWLHFVISGNIQEIDLQFYPQTGAFKFPRRLFTSNSLISLKLNLGFDDEFYTQIVLPRLIRLPRVRTLYLRSISFLDYEVLGRILCGCPVLESLTLINCLFSKNVLVVSSVQLKYLVIESCSLVSSVEQENDFRIMVAAPNLEKLRLNNNAFGTDYSLENLSALHTVDLDVYREEDPGVAAKCVINCLRAISNVKSLRLSASFLQVLSDVHNVLENQPNCFRNLRYMKLTTICNSWCIRSVACLLKSSPNIELFIMYIDEIELCLAHFEEEELATQCVLQQLKSIEIRKCRGCQKEVNFLKFLLKSASNLEKLIIEVSLSCTQEMATEIRSKLLKLPRASPYAAISFV